MFAAVPISLASAGLGAFYSVFGLFQTKPGRISEEPDGLQFVALLQGVCHIVGKCLHRLHDFFVIHAKTA